MAFDLDACIATLLRKQVSGPPSLCPPLVVVFVHARSHRAGLVLPSSSLSSFPLVLSPSIPSYWAKRS